jgi:hypothetical protein
VVTLVAIVSAILVLGAGAFGSGCSVIDAITGDSRVGPGRCDPSFPGCEGDECGSAFNLGDVPLTREVDLCDLDIDRDLLSSPCGSGAIGNDAVLSFELSGGPQDIEICSSAGAGSVLTFVASDCLGTGACLPVSGECVTVSASAGQNFIVWRGQDERSCDRVAFDVHASGSSGEAAFCLDGVDNDRDGFTDCEDDECRNNGACDAFLAGQETCDGIDNGQISPFPAGAKDEAACKCLTDDGCDQIDTGAAQGPYVCHLGVLPAPFEGVCAPNCLMFDWCTDLGFSCMPDGRCVGAADPCVDGSDDEGGGTSGLIDCEDPVCMQLAACNRPIGSETCNGTDDGNPDGAEIAGWVDEGVCGCVSDEGCDNLASGSAPGPYVCHFELGVCGPDCSGPGSFFCSNVLGSDYVCDESSSPARCRRM